MFRGNTVALHGNSAAAWKSAHQTPTSPSPLRSPPTLPPGLPVNVSADKAVALHDRAWQPVPTSADV
eukprot:349682-Chlamydomonas_euryale.AAC.6